MKNLKKLGFISSLLFVFSGSALADFQFTFNGHTYDVITSALNWVDASTAAQNRTINGEPGYLARIDSAEENEEIFDRLMNNTNAADFVQTSAADGGGSGYVWIGASDIQTEGKWLWVRDGMQFWQGNSTGSAVGALYNNWGNEPDDSSGQDAAGIALGDWPSGVAGQWNDLDTGNTLYYIVEYETGPSFSINAGLNDAWFNPATNGQGFFTAVFPNIKRMALAWFTFDTERPAEDVSAVLGEPGHRWLTAQGRYEGDTANLRVVRTTGGVFDAVAPAASNDGVDYGRMSIEFADCSSGLVSYEITSLGITGEIPIQRVSNDNVALCEALVAASPSACESRETDRSHGIDNPPIELGTAVPKEEILGGGPGPDGIPALESPIFMQNSGSVTLNSSELVVGVKIGNDVRAYPHRILNWHEVVNDQFNMAGQSERSTLSYCPLTGSAVLWKSFMEFNDKTFGTSGALYNSNLVMYDRQTESLWSQMFEQSIRGPQIQRIPERLQVVETTWGTWKSMYPETMLLTEETGYSRDYNDYPYGSYREDNSLLFPVDNQDDRRLPRKERVLGINVGTYSRVYPIDNFSNGVEVINDTVDNMQVVVAGSSALNFGVVFNRQLDDCTMLEFESVQNQLPVVMRDNEGGEWDVFGTAVSGPRTGQQLRKTNSYVAYWFAWTAFFSGKAPGYRVVQIHQ